MLRVSSSFLRVLKDMSAAVFDKSFLKERER